MTSWDVQHSCSGHLVGPGQRLYDKDRGFHIPSFTDIWKLLPREQRNLASKVTCKVTVSKEICERFLGEKRLAC